MEKTNLEENKDSYNDKPIKELLKGLKKELIIDMIIITKMKIKGFTNNKKIFEKRTKKELIMLIEVSKNDKKARAYLKMRDKNKNKNKNNDEIVCDSIEKYEGVENHMGETVKNKNIVNKKVFSEECLMNNLINKSKELNLFYDEKDLINFHTSMKSSNLVILSGMSGTGKSKLVKLYAEALGLDRDQVTFIPVRPSWSDDSDLIGYIDSIHNVYVPGDSGLINTLIEASKNKDKIYVICLDEMNLARVEHYFSQFLSVLEMDKNDRILKLYNSDLENKLYNANNYPSSLKIGENILFVGTVNLDESTYHFSDKVLDRANVITLAKLSFEKIYNLKESESKLKVKKISFNEYDEFIDKSNCLLEQREYIFLEEIHSCINKANKNLGIGFRVINQMAGYLANIPKGVNLSKEEGFDIQVVQRILTKVRGSQEQCKDILGDFKSGKYENGELVKILEKYSDISNFEKSKELIENKAKELRVYGYTI